MTTLLTTRITDRDHVRGLLNAPLQLLVYGDYECPFTRKALLSLPAIREALGDALVFGFRNFPLIEIHPHALQAALAAEAADLQGKFWDMHELLFRRQNALTNADLVRDATSLGLDPARFKADFEQEAGMPRIEADLASGERNCVEGTPGIFINGGAHTDAYDPQTLIKALTAIRR